MDRRELLKYSGITVLGLSVAGTIGFLRGCGSRVKVNQREILINLLYSRNAALQLQKLDRRKRIDILNQIISKYPLMANKPNLPNTEIFVNNPGQEYREELITKKMYEDCVEFVASGDPFYTQAKILKSGIDYSSRLLPLAAAISRKY